MLFRSNYGFIPQTLGDDLDPLDILLLSQVAIEPLCLVYGKVIGVMRMIDGGKEDDKIIAVAKTDASVNHIDTIDQVPEYLHREMKHFFEEYTRLENKTVTVDAFQGLDVAYSIIQKAADAYSNVYGAGSSATASNP